MSALQKADHTIENQATAGTEDVCPDVYGYRDDVTAEGVQLLRDKAGDFLSQKKWKVIDGYVGSPAARVG